MHGSATYANKNHANSSYGTVVKIFILANSILLNQFAKFVEKNGFAFGKLD